MMSVMVQALQRADGVQVQRECETEEIYSPFNMDYSRQSSISYLHSLANMFTIMLNTPMIEPETARAPKAVQMKALQSKKSNPSDSTEVKTGLGSLVSAREAIP